MADRGLTLEGPWPGESWAVADIAEFYFKEWTSDLADGVEKWMAERPSANFEIASLRPDGNYYGADEGQETLTVANVR